MTREQTIEILPAGHVSERGTAVDPQVFASESMEKPVRRLEIGDESDYHRVSAGCPKAFTQQCGVSYRT